MKEGLERSLDNYTKLAESYREIVRFHSGIDLEPQVVRGFKVLLKVMRLADQVLDSIGDEATRNQVVELGFGYVCKDETLDVASLGVFGEELKSLRDIYQALPAKRQRIFSRNSSLLLKASEKAKNATTIEEYVKWNRVEGQVCSQIFITLLPEEIQGEKSLREVIKTFKLLTRAGNLFDKGVDMPDDFEEGLTSIEPTLLIRMNLLRFALRDGFLGAIRVSPALYPRFAKLILANSQNNPRK